jgi:hypothetical protein
MREPVRTNLPTATMDHAAAGGPSAQQTVKEATGFGERVRDRNVNPEIHRNERTTSRRFSIPDSIVLRNGFAWNRNLQLLRQQRQGAR